MMIGKLYRARYGQIQNINDRPVDKIEVIQWNGRMVVFKTDYPVEQIEMPEDEFHRKFEKW
jgi:hypothetical protein